LAQASRNSREIKNAEGFQFAVRRWKNRSRLAARQSRSFNPGKCLVLLPIKERETEESPAGYYTSLRQALVDENTGHVNLIVCEADYDALKRGIEHLPPAVH
jgi:hypothetical protein